MKIKDYEFGIGVTPEDFKVTFGREPKNQDEMDQFGYDCKKAAHSQIDWEIIFECVKENWKDS